MEYVDAPTPILDKEIEKAIKRAMRNSKNRRKAEKPVKKYKDATKHKKLVTLEQIMNDPFIMSI